MVLLDLHPLLVQQTLSVSVNSAKLTPAPGHVEPRCQSLQPPKPLANVHTRRPLGFDKEG